jgi:hypothetical protein
MQTIKNNLHKLFLTFALSLSLFGVLILAAPNFALAAIPCDNKHPTDASLKQCLKINPIIKDINTVVDFLSAGAGIIIVGSIIVGGIQYSLAGSNANEVTAAKNRIRDALIALFAFFFIFSFLQWLIPGGLWFS